MKYHNTFLVVKNNPNSWKIWDFWASKITISQAFNVRGKFCFLTFQKPVGDNPHNVYIFGMGDARPFQNRFDHVHTIFLEDSTTAQLGPLI